MPPLTTDKQINEHVEKSMALTSHAQAPLINKEKTRNYAQRSHLVRKPHHVAHREHRGRWNGFWLGRPCTCARRPRFGFVDGSGFFFLPSQAPQSIHEAPNSTGRCRPATGKGAAGRTSQLVTQNLQKTTTNRKYVGRLHWAAQLPKLQGDFQGNHTGPPTPPP